MNGVDDGFEYRKAPRWQANAGSNYYAVVAPRCQLTLDCRPSGFVRPDEAKVGLPTAFSELFHRNRDTGVYLLSGHTRW